MLIIFQLEPQPQKKREIKRNSPNAVVVARFHSVRDRNNVLKAFSEHKKNNNNSPICLRNLGFDSDNIVFVCEGLTLENRKLLQCAVQLKRLNKIASAFSFRGCVYVRPQKDNDPIPILSMSDIKKYD